ncbi:MAG: 4,5-DOPA dioxygenase extradiol [Kofleriaceae bacterium]|nr:4,5-DOPA dioxygenase extradiol [Kofleriaceae bacterium]
MPVVFVGHGSPMNAIEDNRWGRGWAALGAALPRPRGILAVSAHWYIRGSYLTAAIRPETIHDFGGFPRALSEVSYPAPGDPALARRVVELLDGRRTGLRDDWGLDHGTWSVLVHSHPAADIPVVQLSVDLRLPPAEHLAIGRALAPLRDQGVLIVGSGNVTHNLHDAFRHLGDADAPTPPWASRFDHDLAAALVGHDHAFLAAAPGTADGRLAHPSPDHYLPLLYAAGAADRDDPVTFPVEGFDAGSLSMRSVRYG